MYLDFYYVSRHNVYLDGMLGVFFFATLTHKAQAMVVPFFFWLPSLDVLKIANHNICRVWIYHHTALIPSSCSRALTPTFLLSIQPWSCASYSN